MKREHKKNYDANGCIFKEMKTLTLHKSYKTVTCNGYISDLAYEHALQDENELHPER